MTPSVIAITGPTASGKTHLAVALAKELDSEIVSADSRQIYRGMDLGTGKDLEEYNGTPVHMIDICPAGYKYNLFEYLRDANNALNDIASRGKTPVICGGTGLYVESLLNGLQLPDVPENKPLRESLSKLNLKELTAILSRMKTLHNSTDVDSCKRAIRAIEIATYYKENPEKAAGTVKRPLENALLIGISIDRADRRARITKRLELRLENGMIAEVERLLASGISPDDLIYYGLEYKFLTLYVTGEISRTEMFTQLETAIHQFAKRQMTWFRGMERRGFKINWIDWRTPEDEFCSTVRQLYQHS